ncbi:cellulase family glycosylhydrolase [Aquimarina muelleri]|uniref:mannan endo-1,4-beta-mannosidase n=1 Tax=Aquimarina muelleri TaxID=279356 RepID=A0A918N4P4_9FLAO|nr:cellulase family glycosylhydrolase [Aquimarina muelleri]MCX2762550.1 glycoside hydrolase family 5 protein [Aquimarina muelleri]GGX24271.1 glycosyl hydrolase family 5 [Aquimarina muelleri]
MIRWNKYIYTGLLISSFIGVIVLLLFGISQAFSFLNTGADRSSMLHVALHKEQVYFPKLDWIDTINPGRPIEKQTQQDIEQDYLNAWYVRNVAYQSNKMDGIGDYYTKSSRKNIANTILSNKEKNIEIHGTTTNHNIALDFYSADGQLAILSDTNVKEYQRVYREDTFLAETRLQSNYQVLLLLEDGFWRVRHMVKKGNYDQDTSMPSNGLAKVIKDKIYIEDKEYTIKGINYYPQKTPWDMFGDNFDIDIIAKDFDIITEAGLNTIRIFVPYVVFGKAKVIPEKLQRLQEVLDKAEDKNLKVIVTLFDFYGDYSVLDWTLTHRHAEQIVTPLANHKAILSWDIKNEPNLDFNSRGKESVLAWLKEMIYQIRNFDPNHLITIGWSDMGSADLLQEDVDMVSFHYYLDIDEFAQKYKDVSAKISKPLVLQEFGLSSSRGLWSPFGASEKGQANYYEQFQKMIKEENINYLSWTLYDFEEVPTAVVGKLPWRKHKQKHFGFIDSKGNKKPAFEFIK